jgi:hypothetical protein
MRTTDVDLHTQGTYVYEPFTEVGSSPLDLLLTIVTDSQTFSGRVYIFSGIPQT